MFYPSITPRSSVSVLLHACCNRLPMSVVALFLVGALPGTASMQSLKASLSARGELAYEDARISRDVAGMWPFDATAIDSERIVTYEVFNNKGGFNNRLQALQIALLFAISTNRTLVVQPFTEGNAAGLSVPYTAFLENITGLPVRLSTEMGTNWDEDAVDIDLQHDHMNTSFEELTQRYMHSSAKVLRYPDNHGFWMGMFRDEDQEPIRAQLSKHIRFRDGIKAGAALIKTWLGDAYGAVHFRLGDYGDGAKALIACEELGCGPIDNTCCTLELGLSPKSVFAGGLSTDGLGRIYIATNDPDSIRVKAELESLHARGLPAIVWEGIPAKIRTLAVNAGMERSSKEAALIRRQGTLIEESEQLREGVVISCIEQLVCMEAERYLASWPSSWDATVIEERFRLGKVDAAKQHQRMVYELRNLYT